jgi:hypothetical protein
VSTHAEIRCVSPVSGQSIGIDSAPGRNRRTKLANRKAGYLHLGTCRQAWKLMSKLPLESSRVQALVRNKTGPRRGSCFTCCEASSIPTWIGRCAH